jgi:transcriptional regulator with XRE-family HTH domain
MKYRLKQLRKALGLTQREFGEKIGMSDVAISYMESGRTAISKQNIHLICLTFGIREKWLENGSGDMLDDEASLTEYERQILNLYRRLSPLARKMLIEYAEKLLADEQALRGESPEGSKQAPGGTTQPVEDPQEAKPALDTEKGEGPGIGPNPKNGETG